MVNERTRADDLTFHASRFKEKVITMTKLITIDPTEVRQPKTLTAPEIPIHAYLSEPAAEAAKYGH